MAAGVGKLKNAQLIAENPILHVSIAVISDLSGEAVRTDNIENTEVIVSYFGILLGEKTIKFNQDGIRLRAVEIGADFISSPTARKSEHRTSGFCAR